MDNTQDSIRTETSGGEEAVAGTLESQLSEQNNIGNSDRSSPQGVMTDTIQCCTNDQVQGGSSLETQEGGIIPMTEEELEQTQNDLMAVAERLRQNATSPISPHVRPSSRILGRSFVIQVAEASSSSFGSVENNSIIDIKPATATQSSGFGTTSEAREVKEQTSNSDAGPDIPWPRSEWFPPCLFNDPTITFDVFEAFDSSILVGAGESTKSLDPNGTQRCMPVEEVIQVGESAIGLTSAFHLGPSLFQHSFGLFSQRNREGDNQLAEIWSVRPEGIIPKSEVFDTSNILLADQMANTLPTSLQEYLQEHLEEPNNATNAMADEEMEVDLVARGRESPEDGNPPGLTHDLQEHSAESQPALNERSQTSQEHSAETPGESIESSAAQRASLQFGDVPAHEPVPLIQSMSRAQIAAIPTDHMAHPDPEHIRRTIMHYEQNVFYPMPTQNDYSTRQYYMSPEYHGSTRQQVIGKNSYSAMACSSNRVMTCNSGSEPGEQSPCEGRQRGRGVNGRGCVRGRGRAGRGRGY
jgi:hypothetical protein